MARNLNQEEKAHIVSLYKSGCSYKEIHQKTGAANATIVSLVKGLRSRSESALISIKRNGRNISEDGRRRLSEAGKRACQRNGKYWTKPEKDFCKLLRDNAIGVVFPDMIAEIIGEKTDPNGDVYFQYPIQRYVCDFVDVGNKIVFRINGDFWHSNPLLYQDTLTVIQKHNRKQDANCRVFLEKQGWQVVDIWESELKWNVPSVVEKIRAMRKMANPPPLHGGNTGIVTQIAHTDWSDRLKELWFKKTRVKNTINKQCYSCGGGFDVSASNKKAIKRKFCSVKCASDGCRKVDRPTAEQLKYDLASMSYSAVGRKYMVSDNTIRKWLI